MIEKKRILRAVVLRKTDEQRETHKNSDRNAQPIYAGSFKRRQRRRAQQSTPHLPIFTPASQGTFTCKITQPAESYPHSDPTVTLLTDKRPMDVFHGVQLSEAVGGICLFLVAPAEVGIGLHIRDLRCLMRSAGPSRKCFALKSSKPA